MKVSINITVNLVARKKISLTKFEFYEAIVMVEIVKVQAVFGMNKQWVSGQEKEGENP